MLQTHGREMKDFHICSKQQQKMDLLNFIHWLATSLSIHARLTHFPELIHTMATTSSAAPRSLLFWKGGNVAAVELWPSLAHPNLSTLLCTHTTHTPPSAINALLQPGLTSKPPTTPPLLHWRLADPQVTFFSFIPHLCLSFPPISSPSLPLLPLSLRTREHQRLLGLTPGAPCKATCPGPPANINPHNATIPPPPLPPPSPPKPACNTHTSPYPPPARPPIGGGCPTLATHTVNNKLSTGLKCASHLMWPMEQQSGCAVGLRAQQGGGQVGTVWARVFVFVCTRARRGARLWLCRCSRGGTHCSLKIMPHFSISVTAVQENSTFCLKQFATVHVHRAPF